jgi:hypothetical protein
MKISTFLSRKRERKVEIFIPRPLAGEVARAQRVTERDRGFSC